MDLTIDQALQLAIENHKTGNLETAEGLYLAILQAQPKHPDANHNLGILRVSLHKLELALPLFKNALEANQSQGQYWISYVDTLIKTDQIDIAKRLLEQGKKLGLAGERFDALEAQLASTETVHKSKSTLQKQTTHFKQQSKKLLLKKDNKKSHQLVSNRNLNQLQFPSQNEVTVLLEHFQKGRYDLAENLAGIFTHKYPEHQFSWKVLGAVFKITGRFKESLIANQRAVVLSPNDAEAYCNLGIAHLELGRLVDAEASYKKAIGIKPELAEAHFNLSICLKALGRLEEAESSCKKAIAIKPDFTVAHNNLGNMFKELGRLEDAEVSYKKAIAISPDFAEAYSNLGNTLQKLGRLVDAEASYKKAIAIKPEYAEAFSNLGITLKELGRFDEAEKCYKKAIAIKPEYAEAFINLGNMLQEVGRLDDSETNFKNAVAINPDFAEAYSNLGNTLQKLGRLVDAEASYKKAIALKPECAEAFSNLGITLKELGKLKDAEACCKKAIAIQPDYAEAFNNLGVTLKELGRLVDAEECYKKAIAIKPEFAEAYSNLGNTLQELGRLEDALVAVRQSIRIKSTFEAKALFMVMPKKIDIQTWDQSLNELVIASLLEPWGRPSDIMSFACGMLRVDQELIKFLNQFEQEVSLSKYRESFLSDIKNKEFATSSLLNAMLASSPIPDAEIEILLTNLRSHLLKTVTTLILKESEAEEAPALICSIAQQCFINEYVYFQTSEEIKCSHQLLIQLTKALESQKNISEILLMTVACYFPLHSVVGAEKLLQRKWSNNVKILLKQQIQEPLEELNLVASIPVLTTFENQVSLVVQSQYHENPYPRWERLPKDSSQKFINPYIKSKFPLSSFRLLSNDKIPELLVAGCGTGQHPIGTAHLIKGARILAVDLSMTSLAYAKRKTAELEIDSITYAQADLLNLLALDRTFDVIESAGVLHHLENPFEGWEVLISLLRTHGLMRLGFYSEIARRDIVRVRNLIIKEGVGSSAQEIRDYRKYLLELKDSENYGFATSSLDFFSTSACRDLLFHVQEHRMNLKILAEFFKNHNLNFLGFDLDSNVIRSYKKRFPNDTSATNLDQWHIYEEENPDTFIRMYQFWVQKNI